MSEELEKNLDLDEAKATGEDFVAADTVTPTGGAVKKRKGDVKKAADPKADNIEDNVKTPQGSNDEGLKEAVERLFEGTELSEDFKTQTVAAVNHFLRAWPELDLPEDVIRRILFDADLKPMTPRARFSRMIALYATK